MSPKMKEPSSKVLEDPQTRAILVPPVDLDSIVVTSQPFDMNEPIVQGYDLSGVPKFSTKQVAEVFFHHSAAWIRWINSRGLLHKDATGRSVEPERIVDDMNGMKRYSLADIETVARILYQNGIIPVSRLQLALQIVHLIAIGWGVIIVE